MELIEAIRKRPGMFVGSVDEDGVGNLAFEVLANAFDQHLAGRCTRVEITFDADGVVTVVDDGPGIAADRIDPLFTSPVDRPTVDGHRPHVHLGLVLPGHFNVERDRAPGGGSRRTPEAQSRSVVPPRDERASDVRREAPPPRWSQPMVK